MKPRSFLVFLFHLLVGATISLSARAEGTIASKSGPALCGALTVADFQGVGLAQAGAPSVNLIDAGAGAYCVYAGKSAATGGIELDVFHPAGANPAEAKATEETAAGESAGSALAPIPLAGADSARWSPKAVSGGPPFATLVVRRGTLVFVLGIPTGPNAQAQLLKLAALALKRF